MSVHLTNVINMTSAIILLLAKHVTSAFVSLCKPSKELAGADGMLSCGSVEE
jgi:hypothetical protein